MTTPFENYKENMKCIRLSAYEKMRCAETIDDIVAIKNKTQVTLKKECDEYINVVRSKGKDNFDKIKEIFEIEKTFVEHLSYYVFAEKEIPAYLEV